MKLVNGTLKRITIGQYPAITAEQARKEVQVLLGKMVTGIDPVAEALDISAYALKRLLNHRMNNDVTAGYIVTDVERLRKSMQQITDYMLRCMGVLESADVISLSNQEKRSV